jgi:hypothetical protein
MISKRFQNKINMKRMNTIDKKLSNEENEESQPSPKNKGQIS